jgi:hypothetical protein
VLSVSGHFDFQEIAFDRHCRTGINYICDQVANEYKESAKSTKLRGKSSTNPLRLACRLHPCTVHRASLHPSVPNIPVEPAYDRLQPTKVGNQCRANPNPDDVVSSNRLQPTPKVAGRSMLPTSRRCHPTLVGKYSDEKRPSTAQYQNIEGSRSFSRGE